MSNQSFPKCCLGNFVKHHRFLKNLSQGTVAFDLGYKSPQFISNIERGLRLIPNNKISTLAKILSVDADDIRKQIARDKKYALNQKSNTQKSNC